MTKKQTELTIARHWEMLQMLPSRNPGITTAELESRLRSLGWEISRRTIQRDLNNLSSIFPIVCDDERKPHGWYWVAEDRIDLPGFSIPEALSLRLIEDYMKSMLPLSIAKVLEPQFKQARKKLDAVKTDNKSAGWLDKVKVVPPTMPQVAPQIDAEVLQTVQDALINEKQINVTYQKPQSAEIQEWRLHPLGLVQRGTVSYLVCTMFDYDNPILCALHRMKSAELLKEPINLLEDFSLDEYIDKGALHFGSGKLIKFEAIVHPLLLDFLKESPLSDDMVTTSKNDIHKIKATVSETWQFDWWIKSQGSLIEVLKPLALRKKIKVDLINALKQYD